MGFLFNNQTYDINTYSSYNDLIQFIPFDTNYQNLDNSYVDIQIQYTDTHKIFSSPLYRINIQNYMDVITIKLSMEQNNNNEFMNMMSLNINEFSKLYNDDSITDEKELILIGIIHTLHLSLDELYISKFNTKSSPIELFDEINNKYIEYINNKIQ